MAATQCWQDRADMVRFVIKSRLLTQAETSAQLGSTTIETAAVVRYLGVYMDNELNMRVHIGKVAAISFFQHHRFRQLRFVPTSSSMQQLISAFIISWIYYCNSVLYGLLTIILAPLQIVLHAAVRLVAILWLSWSRDASNGRASMATNCLLHHKLCHMMHKLGLMMAINNWNPAYITDTLVPTSLLLHRERLHSHESGGFEVHRVRTEFERRAFSITCSTTWKELPNNVWRTETVTTFKRVLKVHLFKLTVDVYFHL